MIFRTIVVGVAILCGTAAATADESQIRTAVEGSFRGAHVTSVQKSAMPGLWEVVIGTNVVYSDETGSFVIDGTLYDTKTRNNLSQAAKEKAMRVDFGSLPLNLAIKTVKGDGSRVFATFEDPNCHWCKQLHASLAGVTNYTMYTFIDPILSADSTVKAKAIWCSADKSSAWSAAMLQGTMAEGQPGCEAPIAQLMALGRKLNVNGTPTIIFADGSRVSAALQTDDLDRRLNHAQQVASAK